MKAYYVTQYTKQGAMVGVVAGMGRNKNTWDTHHSQRTAQRHAKQLRECDKEHVYKVETD